MTYGRFILASAAVLLTVAILADCSNDGTHDTVIVSVGRRSITKGELAHWISALALGRMVPDPPRYTACVAYQKALVSSPVAELETECRREYRMLKQHALDFLISSDWLIGEAADRGSPISEQEIARRLEEKKKSFANGEAEFKESLKAIGHTVADREIEIATELATSKLRHMLADSERRITQAQVVGYYRRNIRRFLVPERRYFSIVENLRSKAIARRLVREVALGKSLASKGLKESLPRTHFAAVTGLKRVIYEAIFKARPNVVADPVKLGSVYLVFEVTRIVPGTLRPLARVQRAIVGKLRRERRRQTLARFITAWKTKWIAKTDCDPAYVVQKCRRYSGSRTPEDLPSILK
jgi:hypothetical protein